MKACIDLIEQEDPTVAECRQRGTYQTEPGLGPNGLFLHLEVNSFTFSAMDEAKPATRSTGTRGMFFDRHETVDSRVRET